MVQHLIVYKCLQLYQYQSCDHPFFLIQKYGGDKKKLCYCCSTMLWLLNNFRIAKQPAFLLGKEPVCTKHKTTEPISGEGTFKYFSFIPFHRQWAQSVQLNSCRYVWHRWSCLGALLLVYNTAICVIWNYSQARTWNQLGNSEYLAGVFDTAPPAHHYMLLKCNDYLIWNSSQWEVVSREFACFLTLSSWHCLLRALPNFSWLACKLYFLQCTTLVFLVSEWKFPGLTHASVIILSNPFSVSPVLVFVACYLLWICYCLCVQCLTVVGLLWADIVDL